ncbi:HAUS augmin-like complex subunit 6 N-terminus-domain-containing protein [Tricladium varicosporioides]|nr:HAUS augmin-like complex subunit 6 N-terminus-domain-containing protein [Hymenoscyphus varicosporioides]
MQSSNSNIARTRNLRIPPAGTLKLPSNTSTQHVPGPSNVALFLTNLRLLDLDLLQDWPDITTKTFTTKDAQQNQKKRIQCVEWALYQLFVLWDPEETQAKLSSFFPPLEPLQSLNLRAALFRCLDQAKKSGVLGRDTVLRKTMLDECKGERLEEVLAVFSNAVLKKALLDKGSADHEAIAQELAYENFSYSGERTVLSALILAHKISLDKHLKQKDISRAKFKDFSELLSLNERRIARRHEQLKEVLAERGSSIEISSAEVRDLQSKVQKNWSGSEDWLETVLYGDSKVGEDGLLATRFDKVWKHVERGSIGDVESKERIGLLEQLDARVKNQETRLARWQDFRKALSKDKALSPAKNEGSTPSKEKIDLGFNLHQKIQISQQSPGKLIKTENKALDDYDKMIEKMKLEIADVRKPRSRSSRARENPSSQKRHSLLIPAESSIQESPAQDDGEWSSASEDEAPSPRFTSHASKSLSQTPPSEAPAPHHKLGETVRDDIGTEDESVADTTLVAEEPERDVVQEHLKRSPEVFKRPSPPVPTRSPSPLPPMETPPGQQSPPLEPKDSESDLADQILNSMSAASPSPKKLRHTLSLAERTRLSMAPHSKLTDLDDEFDPDELPRLSIKPRPSLAPRASSSETEKLIERTRTSMATFDLAAMEKKAQANKRRSIQVQKKKARESTYFPKVEEERVTPDISAIELIEGDPDYESVFKSRPKIKTSPAVSPTRAWNGESDE